jgi:ornithine decarboxylase
MTQTKTEEKIASYLGSLDYRTPFFVFDLRRVAHNYHHLQKLLPQFDIHYAVKCNPKPGILVTLHEQGASFEVASYNELQELMSLDIRPEEVMFSNPVKPVEDIRNAHAAGLDRFAADSEEEIAKLSTYAPGARVYIRLAVHDKDATFPLSSKFGVSAEEAVVLMKQARAQGLVPYGLSFHVGSQSTHPHAWRDALEEVGRVMRRLDEKGIKIELVNIGGGFPAHYNEPIPTLPAFARVIQESISECIPYNVAFCVEPGRALVADAGSVKATVIGRAKRGDKDWLYIDIGAFHGLMEALETNNQLQYPILTSVDADDAALRLFNLTGPTCDQQDTISYGVMLPDSIQPGDSVYLLNTGAYTISYASFFNGFTPPQTYFIPN